MTAIAAFTIFMHFDGYWIVDSAIADAVLAQPERYSPHVDKAKTKLAACRKALAMGLASGARELHLEGAGIRHSVLTEIRRAGIVPVIVDRGRQTDLQHNADSVAGGHSCGGPK
nr:hypothetical protein [uncultured Duganella sp.]